MCARDSKFAPNFYGKYMRGCQLGIYFTYLFYSIVILSYFLARGKRMRDKDDTRKLQVYGAYVLKYGEKWFANKYEFVLIIQESVKDQFYRHTHS